MECALQAALQCQQPVLSDGMSDLWLPRGSWEGKSHCLSEGQPRPQGPLEAPSFAEQHEGTSCTAGLREASGVDGALGILSSTVRTCMPYDGIV